MSKKPGYEGQEDGQLVTSVTVHFRERWSWAQHRVDASDFFQSVGAAVLAGVLAVIVAPENPVAVATMAAIGGASLMFAANFIWNLYHHARPEILADRLTATSEKIAQVHSRKDRQDALDELARKYEDGVALFADRDKLSAADWEAAWEEWRLDMVQFLESRFTYAKASRFNNLGPIPAVEIPSGRQDVGRQMRLLAHQLEILKIFIGTGEAD